MKIALKYVLKITLAFLALIAVYFVLAFCLSRIPVGKSLNSNGDIAIYIETNGVHTDIIVPVKSPQIDWSKEVKFENTVSKDSIFQYLAVGWGDKGFYLETPNWSDLKTSVAIKAALGLSTTAIHAKFYKKMKENIACKKIMISNKEYSRLINYVANSFQKDENGHYVHIKTNANYGKTDAFYEANGSYSILCTCNTWANRALKSFGQKACLWTPFDTGIFLIYNQ